MKDQFEKNIKSLVEDFSYDYDPKAWEALSKKLPKVKTGNSWYGKIAMAIIVSVSVGIFAIWTNTSSTPTTSKTQKTQPALAKKDKNLETKIDSPSKIKLPTLQKNTQDQTSSTIAQAPLLQTDQIEPSASQITQWVTQISENPTNSAALLDRTDFVSSAQPTLLSDKSNTAEPTTEEPQKPLAPCQGMKVILSAENISYESGYPVVHIHAESSVSNITWSSNGNLSNQKAKGADLLAFKQQTYTVSAQVGNEECHVSESITVSVDQNYNLLAVNAFNPQSRDARNARFMPYALTIRDVRFVLTILDSDNGAVIFNTSDAQNAWDGIDQRTGQLIKAQKAYIWRVILENPLPGEKNTYSGTIVRI